MALDGGLDRVDQFNERRALRSHRVAHAVETLGTLLETELDEIVDVDRPDPVVAPTANGEDRQTTEQPRDVVEQHTVAAKEDGGAQHGVRHAGLGEGALDEGLTSKVRQRGVDTRVRDADVHDALDSGPACRLEERSGVLHGQAVVDPLMGEAHPVGVIERGDTFERRDQANLVVEVEWTNLNGGPARRRLGCPVRVRTWRPESVRAVAMARPE